MAPLGSGLRCGMSSPRRASSGAGFTSIARTRVELAVWRNDYNHTRPHSSLNGLTPKEFAAQQAGSPEPDESSAISPVAYPAIMGQNQNGLSL